MVARMKKALFLLLLTGCASAPTSEHNAAAVGGALGCLAQGFVAAADGGKGELLAAGIVLMPLCAMVSSNIPERSYVHNPWSYRHMPKGRSSLVSRK